MTYDNTNSGALFPNDRRETEDDPVMTGSIDINGVDHWFNGWRESEELIVVSTQRKGTRGDNQGEGEMQLNLDWKGDEDKRPKWKGKLKTPVGDEFELVAWPRTYQKKGKTCYLLSCKLSVPGERKEPGEKRPPARRPVRSEAGTPADDAGDGGKDYDPGF